MGKGFYKKEESGLVMFAPNFVIAPEYELDKNKHESYNLPIDGWFWFESMEEAYTFLGVDLPKDELIN